ncbi:hypothetical protein GPALN_003262 [Globodera pallida]|nr:hypothetical protein GPALN_003262 [Globodera pallida]
MKPGPADQSQFRMKPCFDQSQFRMKPNEESAISRHDTISKITLTKPSSDSSNASADFSTLPGQTLQFICPSTKAAAGKFRQKIWPLVNDNICGFSLCSSVLDRLRQFSPAILRNCPNLRSAFVNASKLGNFIIHFPYRSFAGIDPFELNNDLTRERLTFRKINEDKWLLLVRCPIRREEDKWSTWEKE